MENLINLFSTRSIGLNSFYLQKRVNLDDYTKIENVVGVTLYKNDNRNLLFISIEGLTDEICFEIEGLEYCNTIFETNRIICVCNNFKSIVW